MTAVHEVWTPYCGAAPTPDQWLARWNLDPLLLALLVVGLCMCLRRPQALSRAAGATGVFVLAVIFVSPLCAMSSALFSARTVHHLLLLTLAAAGIAFASRRANRAGLGAATVLQAVVFWTWHAPGLYGWALSSDLGYGLMQISLLGSAVWFWVGVRAARPPAAVAALLATTVQMGLLGAVLTFSSRPLYAPHLASTPAWGLTPVEDQQLAGLIMWAPAALFYLGAALMVLERLIGPQSRPEVITT